MTNIEKTINDYNDAYFDFEVLPEYICVTFFQDKTNQRTIFEFSIDDINLDQKLFQFKNWIQNTSENNIFIGWNVFYDKTILYHILEFAKNRRSNNKLIINDANFIRKNNQPFFDQIFNISKSIVNDTYQGYPRFDKNFIFYDASKYRLPVSLKVVAGEMGLNIEESSVPWDKKNLTNVEKNELLKYNINDVDVLYRINQKYYEAFNIRKELVNEFSSNYLPAVEYKNNYFFNKIFDLQGNKKPEVDEQDDQEFNNGLKGEYNFYESVKDNEKYVQAIEYFYKDKPNLSPELKELYDLFFIKKINIPLDPAKFKDPRSVLKPKKNNHI
ncbi:hypothetical protein [Mycoplasma sp. 2634B]|uniref:hypothetical protein n=1 Tax=Mycoplasma sp. 2634B TaxID=3401692 RepID=UPI003AAA925C